MILKMMEAIYREIKGEAPKPGDIFAFQFKDGVTMIEFVETKTGRIIPTMKVARILESYDANIWTPDESESDSCA